jgi:hypothetical protein
MTPEEIWSAVTAAATLVGVPRLIEVIPRIAEALESAQREPG